MNSKEINGKDLDELEALEQDSDFIEGENETEYEESRQIVKKDNEVSILDNIGLDLEKWIKGTENIPNKDIQTFLNSTADKAQIINSYVVITNMSRISKLHNFINEVEGELFDVRNLDSMSPKQKASLYRMAIQRTQEIMDMNNKYIASQEETVDEETQRLLTIIKTLSPEQIQNLISLVRGNKDNEKSKPADDEEEF